MLPALDAVCRSTDSGETFEHRSAKHGQTTQYDILNIAAEFQLRSHRHVMRNHVFELKLQQDKKPQAHNAFRSLHHCCPDFVSGRRFS